MVTVEELAAAEIFEGLEPEKLARIAAIATVRRFAKGQPIFAEDDPADGLYVVREGRVKVFKLSPDGKEQILHIWGEGEPFGEVAVFAGGRFPAHAEALDDSATVFVPRAALLQEFHRHPELALGLLAVLAARLRRFASLVESLSLKEVPGRLAAYLLLLADRRPQDGPVELDVTKGQLANVVGTTPETLSRILARLQREALIEPCGPRAMQILDRAGLAAIADGTRKLGGS